MLRAACIDQPGPFFAPDHVETRIARAAREAEAKALCQGCPVLEPCDDLVERLEEREPQRGIWAGLTEQERRRRRRIREIREIREAGA
jgi:WhiB family redox-sensing transcriptional regulator